MSSHEVHPGNDAGSGFDAASGLSGDSHLSRDMFGQPIHKTPTALGNHYSPLLENSNGENAAADPLTGMTAQQHQGAGAYGDELRSGIAPIDYVAGLAEKAMDAVEQAVETNTPVVQKAIHEAVTQISESVQHTVETVQQNWNAPDNEVRTTLNRRVNQAIGLFKQKIGDLAADPEVQTAMAAVTRLGQTVAEKTENFIETAQAKTETWMGQAFDSVYVDQSLRTASTRNSPGTPFVGVIDTDFQAEGHGAQVVDTIRQASQRFPDWLGDGVGGGRWADALVKFVDAARASGRTGAVVNLSFDLTQINPDGSVTTRTKLTSAEWNALKYAQNHDVLIVVAAGNQGGTMSALGQASKEFDNIITVGAVENGHRADYSSYGKELNLVASGDGSEAEGTSIAAARVSAAAAKVWAANSALSYQQVIHILESTATDLGIAGWDAETASGKLDAKTAVVSAQNTLEQPLHLPNSDPLNPSGLVQTSAEASTEGVIASERPASLDISDDSVIMQLGNALEGSNLGLDGTLYTDSEEAASTAPDLLQYGDGMAQPSDDVKAWQAFLNTQGLSRQLTEDGQFGTSTKAMTIEFQSREGLGADGIVGEQTKAAAQEKGYGWDISEDSVIMRLGDALEGSSLNGLEGTASTGSDLLQYGDGMAQPSDDVKAWQAFLNRQGLSMQLAEDGQFGSNTQAMTIEFQARAGIRADGIVGEQTKAAAQEKGYGWDISDDSVIMRLGDALEGSNLGLEGAPYNTAPDLLQYGDGMTQASDDVRDWQAFLNSQGLSKQVTEDGQFGANTRAMTIEFQLRKGLGADGIVGEKTKAAAQETRNDWDISENSVIMQLANAFEESPIIGSSLYQQGYRVQPGETLESIAEEKLGDPDLWRVAISKEDHKPFTEEEARNIKPGDFYWVWTGNTGATYTDDLATGYVEGFGHAARDAVVGIRDTAQLGWGLITADKETVDDFNASIDHVLSNPKEAAQEAVGEALNLETYQEYIENEQYTQAIGHGLADLVILGATGGTSRISRLLQREGNIPTPDSDKPDLPDLDKPDSESSSLPNPHGDATDVPAPHSLVPESTDSDDGSPTSPTDEQLSSHRTPPGSTPQPNESFAETESTNIRPTHPSASTPRVDDTTPSSEPSAVISPADESAGPFGGRGGANPINEPNSERTHRGVASNRPFNLDNVVLPVVDSKPQLLDLSTERLNVTPRGVARVEQHLSRFDSDPPNQRMIERLRAYAEEYQDWKVRHKAWKEDPRGDEPKKPEVEAEYLNFYAHELRESTHYRKRGYEDQQTGAVWQPTDPDPHDVWDDLHTATLEEYGHTGGELYHPSALVNDDADTPRGGRGPDPADRQRDSNDLDVLEEQYSQVLEKNPDLQERLQALQIQDRQVVEMAEQAKLTSNMDDAFQAHELRLLVDEASELLRFDLENAASLPDNSEHGKRLLHHMSSHSPEEFREAQELIQHWSKGTYDDKTHSVVSHFDRKLADGLLPEEIDDILIYLRRASQFDKTEAVRIPREGSRMDDRLGLSVRWENRKTGEYRIETPNGEILSYGFNQKQ